MEESVSFPRPMKRKPIPPRGPKKGARPPTDVVLFAPIGSNPAHLVSLVWALHERRGLRVRAARLVAFAAGQRYLDEELLAPRAGLALLHGELDRTVLPRRQVRVRVPVGAEGAPLEDDADERDAEAFYDAALAEARAAIVEAGDKPVVFALIGGSRRTLTVATTLIAQYLARPQDHLVDVRYAPKHAADLAGRFFFPTQPDQTPLRLGRSQQVRPAEVVVDAVDVPIPRIGGLLADHVGSYRGMLERGQAAIDAASMPTLVFDLRAEWPIGTIVWPNRKPDELRVSLPVLLSLAALALAHQRGQTCLRAARATDGPEDHPFVELVGRFGFSGMSKHRVIAAFSSPRSSRASSTAAGELDRSLNKLRSDMCKAVRRLCAKHALPASAFVPVTERRRAGAEIVWTQRLPCRSEVLLP